MSSSAAAAITEKSFPHSRVFMRPDGIIVIDITENVIIGRKESEEIVDAVEIITGGKEAPNLVLLKPGNSVDKEAREFSASPRGMQFTKADAMVIRNFPQKIIANFYLKIDKPEKPTRFFLDEDEAVDWLKNFL